ncbi:secreted RxLR effector protein 161-like [Castanea sativa]|uniref:secreted RxLR effector protein 161-like n=1 Tax=Castanea sativa TaxID=21020 RepID=UPI003F6523C0
MNEPSKIHLTAAKRILRYLNGTKKLGIKYVKEKDNKLVGYTDSDWAGSIDDRKSTSGYLFCLGTKPISWSSKKQKTVALSSAEPNIAATDAACEAVWLRRILSDMQQSEEMSTIIYCDNMSAIAISGGATYRFRASSHEVGMKDLGFLQDYTTLYDASPGRLGVKWYLVEIPWPNIAYNSTTVVTATSMLF